MMSPGTPRRHTVLIVDDSAFMRKLIAEMLATAPEFDVVGVARNGVEALEQIAALGPELVTLDLEMPHLDGLQVLQQVMSQSPRPIVVLSAGGAQFGDATMRALELGAVDVVKKPSGTVSLDLPLIRDRLLEALRAAAATDVRKIHPLSSSTSPPPEQIVSHPAAMQVVVIGASTGGPLALAEIIPRLPAIPAAVLVAQHIPREFTQSLATRLDRSSILAVTEAVDGEPIRAGRVYVAPGRSHMRLTGVCGDACISLEPVPPQLRSVAPSADELFRSAASVFGPWVVGVVLTGMGRDGAEGAQAIRTAGGTVLVQDQETSLIYGMPRVALLTAGADDVVPLSDMASAITFALLQSRPPVELFPGELGG